MSELAVPEGLRICSVCGDLACGEICPTCEQLGDRYDALYHADRAAHLFREVPRAQEEVQVDDGLGAMRGCAFALKLYVAAALVMFLAGILLRRLA